MNAGRDLTAIEADAMAGCMRLVDLARAGRLAGAEAFNIVDGLGRLLTELRLMVKEAANAD